MLSKKDYIWVFKPVTTGNKSLDAPKEVQIKDGSVSLGRNIECGVQDPHVSKSQILAKVIDGNDSQISIKHTGRHPSIIIPLSPTTPSITITDGKEVLMGLGDKICLIENRCMYVLTKKAVNTVQPGGELKRSPSGSSIARSESEMSELQDMFAYSQSLIIEKKRREKGVDKEKGHAVSNGDDDDNDDDDIVVSASDSPAELAKQLSTYFPDRDPHVIETVSKLCKTISSGADMLLSNTDEDILSMNIDGHIARLRDIVGDDISDETIKEALLMCEYDIERATNKILADNFEAEQQKKNSDKDDAALKKLRETYPTVDENILKVAIEASGGDVTIAGELISAEVSAAGKPKSPGCVDKKKPRIDDGDDKLIGVDKDWDKYSSSDPVEYLKAKFPKTPVNTIKSVLRECGEDVVFAEVMLKDETDPSQQQKRPPSPPLSGSLDKEFDPDISREDMVFVLKSDPEIGFLDSETLEEGLKATRYKSPNLAKRWIRGTPEEKTALEIEAKVIELKQLFPSTDDKVLKESLLSHNKSVEETISFLFGDVSSAPVPPPHPPLDPEYNVDQLSNEEGVTFKHLKSMFPDKDDNTILAAIEASNNDVEFATEYLVKGIHFANYKIYDCKKVDYTIPCQSTRNIPIQNVDRFLSVPSSSVALENSKNYIKQCFLTMLKREQDFYKDYYVFYHSYSFAHILYELNSVLAPLAYHAIPKNFPPLPRLLLGPFADMPEMSMLIERFRSMGTKDHDSKYRSLAISVSTSLFASSSEAPPTSVFITGYSCTDLSFRGLLKMCLESCNIPSNLVEHMMNDIINVGKKYGLEMSNYCIGGPMAIPSTFRSVNRNFGHMLQIFVHKDYIDEVAYSSLPYGVPTGKKLSECLERGDVDGQARIFMNPELFTDITKTRIFYYSSSEKFYNMREQFIKDLRNAVKVVFDNPAFASNAKVGIKGL